MLGRLRGLSRRGRCVRAEDLVPLPGPRVARDAHSFPPVSIRSISRVASCSICSSLSSAWQWSVSSLSIGAAAKRWSMSNCTACAGLAISRSSSIQFLRQFKLHFQIELQLKVKDCCNAALALICSTRSNCICINVQRAICYSLP